MTACWRSTRRCECRAYRPRASSGTTSGLTGSLVTSMHARTCTATSPSCGALRRARPARSAAVSHPAPRARSRSRASSPGFHRCSGRRSASRRRRPSATNRRRRCDHGERCRRGRRRGRPQRALGRMPGRRRRTESGGALTTFRVSPTDLPTTAVEPDAHAYPQGVVGRWAGMWVFVT